MTQPSSTNETHLLAGEYISVILRPEYKTVIPLEYQGVLVVKYSTMGTNPRVVFEAVSDCSIDINRLQIKADAADDDSWSGFVSVVEERRQEAMVKRQINDFRVFYEERQKLLERYGIDE